jgi:hypothetical protein
VGLFGRLLKLHSGAVPLEDFFTEVVAHLFEAEPQTCLAWIEHAGLLTETERHGVRVTTQQSLDALEHHATGSRPDMLIEAFDEVGFDAVLVESKIGSREGPEQLRRYAELLRDRSDAREKTLVYITRDYDPKDTDEILADIGNGRVGFMQSRWHDFYHFLRTRPRTTLIEETLLFMEGNHMAQNNQFTAVDVLALSNMHKAFSMMDETMQGEVSEKFKEVTGKLLKSPAQTLSNLKERRRYLLFAVLQDGWSFWCGLGYHLPSASVTEYASVDLFVEVLSGSNLRHEIIKAMQEIAEQRGWYDVNLSNLGAGWSRVGRGRSLQDFLSSEDHVAEIKKFFLESLEELREIKEQYPHLPWGGST